MSYWDDLTRSVTEPGHHVMFLVCENETVVGCTYGLVDRARSEWGRVGGMWVDPAWRRRGIGMILLQAVVTWARDRGLRRLGLWAAGHSPAPVAFDKPLTMSQVLARVGATHFIVSAPKPKPKPRRHRPPARRPPRFTG